VPEDRFQPNTTKLITKANEAYPTRADT